ncbi:putative reverse transcriptase [Operophtera brumata]|uniref:Putative reverse transcriptase n=1 Tax=Operophtera brumata TaxID=104452 RepID=A0A0L7LV00_OPEBR|nr:putative reverse transcriptase [Operophtera brumata]
MVDKYFKIGLYNPGSLGTNHESIIASFDRYSMDLIAINETWIRPGEDDRAPTIPNYRLRHIPRPAAIAGRGGGVGFYVRKGVAARIWTHPVDPLYSSVEQMWLTMTVRGKKLVIGTAYRPQWLNVDVFFDAITDSVNASPKCDDIILLGDFNLNDNGKLNKFRTFLDCLGLSQLVTMPTHFTDSSESLLDVICTKLSANSIIDDPPISAARSSHEDVIAVHGAQHQRGAVPLLVAEAAEYGPVRRCWYADEGLGRKCHRPTDTDRRHAEFLGTAHRSLEASADQPGSTG